MDEYLVYVAVARDDDGTIASIESSEEREALKFLHGHCAAEGYGVDDYYVEQQLCKVVSTKIVYGELG